MWIFVFFLCLLVESIPGCRGQCEFPASLQGEFLMSKFNSMVTVNSTTFSGIQLPEAVALEARVGTTYECVANASNKFVLRSALGAIEPGETEGRHVYFCADFTVVSQAKITYIQATQTGPGTKPYDSKYLTATQIGADPVTSVCDIPESSYTPGEYTVMLKISEQISWPQMCPTDILGVYDNQDPACPLSADVCTDNQYIQLENTTLCTVTPFFSGNGSVACVHETSINSITYLHVYNTDSNVDNINTFKLTCLAMTFTSTGAIISQNPGNCVANQRPDTATADGQMTFTLSQPDQSKLCPLTTTSTTSITTTTTPLTTTLIYNTTVTTTTSDTGLTTAASVGLALGLLVLLVLLLLLLLCLVLRRRRKKKKMEEARLREERRQERRRVRRERRLKRLQDGQQADGEDSDSSDSGYSARSTTSLVRPGDEDAAVDVENDVDAASFDEARYEEVVEIRKNQEEEEEEEKEGEREEEDNRGKDTNAEDKTDERGVEGKQKRVKKKRKHIRTRTMEDGTEVEEVVESEYWSSDSGRSARSSRSTRSGQGDLVGNEVYLAERRRKRERRSMMHRSTGDNVKSLVPRDEAERTHSPERKLFTLPKIFRKLVNGKKKMDDDVTDNREVPDSDRFLPQYHQKKQTEYRLEDEGFWDDPKTKKHAVQIFDFDNLDSKLDRSVSSVQSRRSQASRSSVDQEMPDNVSIETERKVQDERPRSVRFHDRPKRPSRFVSGSHDDTCEELPSIVKNDTAEEQGRQQVLASISRMLTDRLFDNGDSDNTKYNTSTQRLDTVTEDEGTRSSSKPNSRFPALPHSTGTPSNNNNSRVETLPALDNSNRPMGKFEASGRRGNRQGLGASSGHGYLRNRRSPYIVGGKRSTREAWGNEKLETEDASNIPGSIPRKTRGGKEFDDSRVDHNDVEFTRTSGDAGYLELNDARLRRLLEELYKDKKYMDALLAAEDKSSNDEVINLAKYGRNYLLGMARYWERKGPLPPRPSTTALGFKMERQRTQLARRAQTANAPESHRNETIG